MYFLHFIDKEQILCYNFATSSKKQVYFMKKIIAALLAVLLLFSLASCTSSKKTALVISGTEIDSEIFTYYLDKIIHRPADYGLAENPERKLLRQTAIDECKKYVAVNTSFRDKGLSLSAADKVEISDNVNYFWVRFEKHYDEIGVSKQTLTKIMTCNAYEDAIFTATYDRGIENAAAEKELTDYFYSNYVSFRTVCAYFTAPDGTPMSQADKIALVESFGTLARNTAVDAQEFSETVTAAGYTLSDSIILKKNSDGYPSGFFEKVYAQANGTVQILEYDECVFAVMKENLEAKGEAVYVNYRTSCINDLYSDASEDEIKNYMETLTVEEKNADRIINKMT